MGVRFRDAGEAREKALEDITGFRENVQVGNVVRLFKLLDYISSVGKQRSLDITVELSV